MGLPLKNYPLQAQSEEQYDLEIDDHVTIPDMFVSFLAQKPQINPHYDRVKGESEAWIAELVIPQSIYPLDSTRNKRITADYAITLRRTTRNMSRRTSPTS